MYGHGYRGSSILSRLMTLGILVLGFHIISKSNVLQSAPFTSLPGKNVVTAVERKLDNVVKTHAPVHTNSAFNTVPFKIYQ